MKKTTFLYNVPFAYTLSGSTNLYLTVRAYDMPSGAAIYFDELPASMTISVCNWPEVLKEIEQIAINNFNN